MKKTLLCVLICLMGCFALYGCGKPETPEPYGIMEPTEALYGGLDLLEPQSAKAQSDRTEQVRYDIVVDDGFGMKGFVAQYCMSYRAALSAVSSVGIGAECTYLRASELLINGTSLHESTEPFFQEAVQEPFFQEESNDIASVITAMAKRYQRSSDRLMILISDLMIPTEDDCVKAATALRSKVLQPENATLGIIAIVGEFRGAIENLPVNPATGRTRKLSDYMVQERDADGNFRHPLYLLFMGDDRQVLGAMQKALASLESGGLLDESTPHYALFFSEYGVSRRDKDDIFASFSLGYQQYDAADYPAQFLVRGLADEAGAIRYPSAEEVPESYQRLLEAVPIAKIYDLERGSGEQNVKVRCTVPFTLTDSLEKAEDIVDKYGLVVPAGQISFSREDCTVTTQIRMLTYRENAGAQPEADWVEPSTALVRCESAVIDEAGETIEIVLSVDTAQLAKDEPLLCTISVRVAVTPRRETLNALYDTDWVNALTLNLKTFDREFVRDGQTTTSARYTYATTARTPFLSNLLIGGIADGQIALVDEAIRDQTEACVQTVMFGMVVRDVPGKYLSSATWEETEDFGGWAFSVVEAKQIQTGIQ